MEYRTCTYIRDDGNICKSAAVTDRNLCLYHFEHRARLMRMAQYRARRERFDLQLPPLESMHAVQSALTQLSEALAADTIDLKRADRLMRLLNIASRNLLKADKWPACPYHSDQPAPAVDLAADYGLPADLDLNTPPEVAFPPTNVILSGGGLAAGVEGPALDLSSREQRPLGAEPRDPFISPQSAGGLGAPPLSPVFGDSVGIRDYMAEAEAAMEYKPEDIELMEILKTQGHKAWERRAHEHQRDDERRKQRRLFRANYARYAAEAKAKNIQRAAEKLMQERLAAERAEAKKKPPASTSEFSPEEAKSAA